MFTDSEDESRTLRTLTLGRMSLHIPSSWRTIFLLTLALAFRANYAEGLTFYQQRESASPAAFTLASSPYQVVIDLSGAWETNDNKGKGWAAGWLPGCYSDENADAQFRRSFTLADSLKKYRFQLHVPESHYSVETWLNGRLIYSHSGGGIGYVCDVTREHVKFGSANELILKVSNKLSPDATLPVAPRLLQPVNYGGIFSGVHLRCVPDWSLEDLILSETYGKDTTQVLVDVTVRIARYAASPQSADSTGESPDPRILVQLVDSSGSVIAESRSEVIAQTSGTAFNVKMNLGAIHPQYWSPSGPRLYTLRASLIAADTLHTLSRVIGFKRLEIRLGDLFLNGERLRVRAMDYEPEASRGRAAISRSQMERDLSMMKDLKINTIRVPSRPPSQDLFDLADRMGLLVMVECGVNWVPPEVLASNTFRALVDQAVDRVVVRFQSHPSVLAWSLGGHLDWSDERAQSFAEWLREKFRSRSGLPCYAETAVLDMVPTAADVGMLALDLDRKGVDIPPPGNARPLIFSHVGALAGFAGGGSSESSSGIVRQAELLVRAILEIENQSSADGFVVHAFSDYHGCSPLLSQPLETDPHLYTFGVTSFNRQERIAFLKLRDLAQTGQVSPPNPEPIPEPSPAAFPAIGLAGILLLSLELRRNNVFRQNLKRVFLHAHGFYSDLRYRRFLHTAQPLLLWLLESVTLALLTESLLFARRMDLGFDFVLTQLLPWTGLKASLVTLIWEPWRAVGYFTLAYLILFLVLTVCVRICSLPFRERVDSWQSANYVLWSFAALLLLLPVGVIFYRLLDSPEFRSWALMICGGVGAWSILRLFSAMRTGFGTTMPRIMLTGLAVVVALGVVFLFLAGNTRQTLTYISFFQKMLG